MTTVFRTTAAGLVSVLVLAFATAANAELQPPDIRRQHVERAAQQVGHGALAGPVRRSEHAATAQVQPVATADRTDKRVGARIGIRDSARHGEYIVDGDGRALYLFTKDTRASGGEAASSECIDACATAWSPMIVAGAPRAGEGADASLIATMTRPDGKTQATYNGWPLYYWVGDRDRGYATGQDLKSFGGEWYLVTPAGDRAPPSKGAEKATENLEDLFAQARFREPECVRRDPERDRYLVTNVNGGLRAADGNGFISVIDVEAGLVDEKWVESGSGGVTLHAPKGMAIDGDTLYVADIGHVHSFDIANGAHRRSVAVPGAKLLNGIAVAENGSVFVTDSGTRNVPGAIYRIRDGNVDRIAHGRDLHRPNGIAVDADGHLVVVTFAAKQVITLSQDGSVLERRELAVGKLDGLIVVGDDTYVSSWTGKAVLRLKPDGSEEAVLTNARNPACFDVDQQRNLLLTPLLRENRVDIATLE